MIDVDKILRAELRGWFPAGFHSDWADVAERAGLARARRLRRATTTAAAATAVAVALGIGTPLGAALVRSFDGFSTWLTGEPGTPASQTEQRAFDAANSRTWLRFPKGTQLRHLTSTEVDGNNIELLGFRSGSSALCLRLHVTGRA